MVSRFDLDDVQKEELIEWWLRDMDAPETPYFVDGDVTLSAIDIAAAIRENTEFGREQLVSLFLMREGVPGTLEVHEEAQQFIYGSSSN